MAWQEGEAMATDEMDVAAVAAAVAAAEEALGDPARALEATALLAERVMLAGEALPARWRALEGRGVVSPYTLCDLVAEALEATPPDLEEARRLIARGDDLLWEGWRDVLEHLGPALLDLLALADPPLLRLAE